jgi:predicted nucleotide-binding protein
VPTPPVIDQEFIVHLFAPLDGPQAPLARTQVQRIWAACRDQLGMSGHGIAGLPGPDLPTAEAIGRSATDSVLAFLQDPAGVRQAVLRRSHDVLNLSVAMAQPAPAVKGGQPRGLLRSIRPAGTPPPHQLGWTDYAALWAQVSSPTADVLLGEVRVFLATVPGAARWGTPLAVSPSGPGQDLSPLLPYSEDRPGGWWRRGITTTAGYALWDTELAGTSPVREIVLLAAAGRDEDVSAWVWSDRTPAMPPFARYLMHAAKLRFEARLLESWHAATTADPATDSLVTELSTILEPERQPSYEDASLLESLRKRLRAQETGLMGLDADLARLEQTVLIAQRNLAAQPGCGPREGTAGLFAADQSLADYVIGQVSSDRAYLQIDLNHAKSVGELAAFALDQLDRPGAPGGAASAHTARGPRGRTGASDDAPEGQLDATRQVFVVHGRDGVLAKSFFDLLRAVDLRPLEWERLVRPTGTVAPYLGDVVRNAPHLAQANLVLLSPDDIVELHPDLCRSNDHPYERARAGQARPNVIFELGLAYMAYPERTVIVEVGQLRPIADLAGLNVIRFDGSAIAIRKVISRLTQAGCPADTSGEDWLDTSRFADLKAYRRGPGAAGAASGKGH